MKKLLNIEVCRFREQYTGSIEQYHFSENLDCQKGGGTCAQCTGPIDRHSHGKCACQFKKKKEKRKMQMQHRGRQSKRILSIHLDADENSAFCISLFFFFVFWEERHKWDYALFSGSRALYTSLTNIFF